MRRIGTALVAACLSWLPCQAADKDDTPTKSVRPSVVVAQVANRDVSRQKRYVGRVQSIHLVQLTARVEGFLEQRNFKEGGFVKTGDLLFVIEQSAYKAALEQSEADLASSQAQLRNNQVEYNRNKNLANTKDVTQEALESSKATLDVSDANVKKAEAGVTASKLNLSYTEIRSPIDGRISAANVDVGNLVGPGSGVLATIVSLDPIYVTFQVSERDLIEARKAGIVRGADTPLTPHLELTDGSAYAEPGKIDYLGVQVDQNTDTIEVRAKFSNSAHVLVPGQFVSVTVKTDQTKSALVVPQRSLQLDQSGHYVLVVDKDGRVARRTVTLGQQVDNVWVVTDGLTQGEQVIVEGIQKVTPGDLVNVVEQKV